MIHYTCDRCKRQIDPNQQTRYVVQIDIQSSTDEPCSSVEDDIDQLAVLHQSLEESDYHALNDADCDDGAFCNGLETCDVQLGCQTGTPPPVDDGVACTNDSCDEVNDVVVNLPNNGFCDIVAFYRKR